MIKTNKPFVALLMQKSFIPDGWLTMIWLKINMNLMNVFKK
jgi:hypothetical protein